MNQSKLRKLIAEAGAEDRSVKDTEQKGLHIRLRDGKGTFYFRATHPETGERIKKRIAGCDEVTLEQARRIAAKLMSDMYMGLFGLKEKPQKTLADVFAKYIKDEIGPRRASSTVKYYRNYFEAMRDYHRMPVAAFTPELCSQLHREVKEALGKDRKRARTGGQTGANRTLAVLSTLLGYSMKLGLVTVNAASTVRRFRETPRERFLSPQELKRFFLALQAHDGRLRHAQDLTMLLLFSGLRKGSGLGLRFDEWDRKARKLTVTRTKSGKTHEVYCVDPVQEMLVRRQAEGSEWVFARIGNKGKPMTDIKRGFASLCELAQVENFTIHDLKRTFLTYAYESEVNPQVVAAMGGHAVPGITARVYGKVLWSSLIKGYQQTFELMARIGGYSSK
jgi:integrase